MQKAIIYDLDDLMVNSDPLHVQTDELLLEEHGHKFAELPKELRSGFIGMRVTDILKEIVKYLNLNVDLDSLYQKRTEIFLKLVKEKLEAMPGLNESLELFKTNGFKIALASSGAKEYINLVLDKFNIKKIFDVIVSGDDVKSGKPHPETYLITSEKLGVKPKKCLVLEDSTKGIESAKSAGCKCIAIINPYTPTQDNSKADIVLNSLNEITLDMVNSLT